METNDTQSDSRPGHGKQLVIALVGPTCTGKTALAIKLAELLNAEVIACDSRTVYRHMNIGTAKPTLIEQAGIRHHLIDIVDPGQTYTAADYKKDADLAAAGIDKSGRLALVCGGTGFYARAFLEGLDMPGVAPDPALRAQLKALAEAQGNEALAEKLSLLDPVSALKINSNDRVRLVRALEVSIITGQPFSSLARRQPPAYRTLWLGLTVANRANLHRAIARRFAEQMAAGLLAEVDFLLGKYGPCPTIMNTVNYKELSQYIQGKISRPQAEELCLKHNRHLARRQLIWFRANPAIEWLAVDELPPGRLLERALLSARKALDAETV